MKFRSDRAALLSTLKNLKPIAPGKSVKPVLDGVLFSVGAADVTANVTDLDISHAVDVRPADGEIHGQALVRLVDLIDALSCADEDVITLERDPTEEAPKLRIRAGACTLDLDTMPADEFPDPPRLLSDPKRNGVDADELLDALKFVDVAASKDTTRYQLNGVYVESKPGKLILTATDGKRLTNVELKGAPTADEFAFILPNEATAAVLRMLKATDCAAVRIQFDEKEARFATDDQTIITRVIDGCYPNYQSCIPDSAPISAEFNVSDLVKVMDGARKAVDKDLATIVMRIGEGAISTEAGGRFKASWSTDATTDGDVEMRFNPFYFLEALKSFPRKDRVTIKIHSASRPARLVDARGFSHFCMPLSKK